ncbi:MAG TPA: hypothetical protein PK890_12135 [Terrimesophilobacter sp.]|nr:hypothetical protein [Terrimesophilobacter sp.]
MVIAFLAGALVLSIVATKAGRHWAIAPVALLIALAIVAPLVNEFAEAPHPVFTVTVIVLLVTIGVVGGSPFVIAILELAGSDKDALGEHGGILVTDTGSKKAPREILRGGATIGYLERLFMMGAALIGQFAAVAIVVAVKGLGRFNELENAAARERFIIGTLASIVWAGVCVAPALIGWTIGPVP